VREKNSPSIKIEKVRKKEPRLLKYEVRSKGMVNSGIINLESGIWNLESGIWNFSLVSEKI